MAKLTPPFGWYGGKTLMADWVIENLPKHDNYLEPFGGSAAVLLAKPNCRLETYNDLNSGVVNFYRVLREGGVKLAELKHKCELTLHSREEFNHCRELIKSEPVMYADLNHAWAWYTCAWQAFAGDIGKGKPSWGFSKKLNNPLCDTPIVAKSQKNIADFDSLHNRLQYVQIENIDALKLMRRMDSPDLLMYLDPPYDPSTGDTHYKHEIDQSEFIGLCLSLKSMIVLSGFDCELYQQLDKAGWDRVTQLRPIPSGNSNSAVLNGKRNYKTEILWLNQAAKLRMPQKELWN